jgi:hypothetical protein
VLPTWICDSSYDICRRRRRRRMAASGPRRADAKPVPSGPADDGVSKAKCPPSVVSQKGKQRERGACCRPEGGWRMAGHPPRVMVPFSQASSRAPGEARVSPSRIKSQQRPRPGLDAAPTVGNVLIAHPHAVALPPHGGCRPKLAHGRNLLVGRGSESQTAGCDRRKAAKEARCCCSHKGLRGLLPWRYR